MASFLLRIVSSIKDIKKPPIREFVSKLRNILDPGPEQLALLSALLYSQEALMVSLSAIEIQKILLEPIDAPFPDKLLHELMTNFAEVSPLAVRKALIRKTSTGVKSSPFQPIMAPLDHFAIHTVDFNLDELQNSFSPAELIEDLSYACTSSRESLVRVLEEFSLPLSPSSVAEVVGMMLRTQNSPHVPHTQTQSSILDGGTGDQEFIGESHCTSWNCSLFATVINELVCISPIHTYSESDFDSVQISNGGMSWSTWITLISSFMMHQGYGYYWTSIIALLTYHFQQR